MQTNYTEQCLKKLESYQCRIRFEVWCNEINMFFYYDDERYFNL